MDGPVLAWHGDEQLHADAIERMRKHRAQDDFVQGAYVYAYIDGGRLRGCFHGCLTAEKLIEEGHHLDIRGQSDAIELPGVGWHDEGERLWGIPAPVGALLDRIFESLDKDEAGTFAVRVTEAMKPGVDLAAAMTRWNLELGAPDDVFPLWPPEIERLYHFLGGGE